MAEDEVRVEREKKGFDTTKWDVVIRRAVEHEKDEKKKFDRFVKRFRDGQYGNESDSKKVSANLIFARTAVWLSLLHGNTASFYCKANEMGSGSEEAFFPLVEAGFIDSLGTAKREFARTLQRYLNWSYRQAQTDAHNAAAVFSAILRGLGVTKLSWDNELGVERIDALHRHELYIDPDARFLLNQARYVVQTVTMHVDEARVFLEERGVKPSDIKPNYEALGGRIRTTGGGEEEDTSEHFRFYEVWDRGVGGEEPRLFYYSLGESLLGEIMPWPFRLKDGDFPFQLLSFYRQGEFVKDAFPSQEVVESLRSGYEDMLQAINQKGKRSIARKIIVREGAFTDDQFQLLKNPTDAQFVKAKGELQDAWRVLELNNKEDPAADLAAIFKATGDEVVGIDELTRLAVTRGNMSATEADIRDENSKMRSNSMQGAVDKWQTRQAIQRSQLARQLLPMETMAKISGTLGAYLWALHAGDEEDLLSEYSVAVQSGSSSERSKRDKLERLYARFEMGERLNQQAMGLPVVRIDEIFKDITRIEDDGDEAERYINQELQQIYATGQLMFPPQPAPEEEQMYA